MQLLGVLFQQGVGDVVDLTLRLRGLVGMGNAQRQNHLILPQGDGVHQRGLNLLHHHIVVVLDHADLGRGLDGNGAGQFQIVDLLLKPVALVRQIFCRLRVLRKSGGLRRGFQLFQLAFPHLLQLLLARQNVHAQLLEVGKVLLVHLIQHRGVLQQPYLMLLERVANLLHIDLCLGVAALHDLQLVRLLAEEAKEALFLLGVEAFQLTHHVDDQVAHLAQVLCAHIGEGSVGEVGHLLLGARAVLQDLGGVLHVDLLGKIIHHLLLLGRQHRLGDLGLLQLRFLGHDQLGRVFQLRLQSQAGNGGGFVHIFVFCVHN